MSYTTHIYGVSASSNSDAVAGCDTNLLSAVANDSPRTSLKEDSDQSEPMRELLPAPFFRYRDFSEVEDPDPLTPLTFPGKVPNFTAKMHAILSRPDLSDIVAWMPHGRAWKILKPREFEVRVIVSLADEPALLRAWFPSFHGAISHTLNPLKFCSPFTLSTASTPASSVNRTAGGSEG